ncbi:hypothetical protein IE53DRAFT_369996 [Violaceomyces palustris]|uniref:Uncharacterized protein n=1 Tax=Violaceomyces palustris TaxID=1673888 RepID=A0ACD0NTP0_9BASI|nr:hypothetical protein IE53DRAFT_369996 [Violaceomyces palustris]
MKLNLTMLVMVVTMVGAFPMPPMPVEERAVVMNNLKNQVLTLFEDHPLEVHRALVDQLKINLKGFYHVNDPLPEEEMSRYVVLRVVTGFLDNWKNHHQTPKEESPFFQRMFLEFREAFPGTIQRGATRDTYTYTVAGGERKTIHVGTTSLSDRELYDIFRANMKVDPEWSSSTTPRKYTRLDTKKAIDPMKLVFMVEFCRILVVVAAMVGAVPIPPNPLEGGAALPTLEQMKDQVLNLFEHRPLAEHLALVDQLRTNLKDFERVNQHLSSEDFDRYHSVGSMTDFMEDWREFGKDAKENNSLFLYFFQQLREAFPDTFRKGEAKDTYTYTIAGGEPRTICVRKTKLTPQQLSEIYDAKMNSILYGSSSSSSPPK